MSCQNRKSHHHSTYQNSEFPCGQFSFQRFYSRIKSGQILTKSGNLMIFVQVNSSSDVKFSSLKWIFLKIASILAMLTIMNLTAVLKDKSCVSCWSLHSLTIFKNSLVFCKHEGKIVIVMMKSIKHRSPIKMNSLIKDMSNPSKSVINRINKTSLVTLVTSSILKINTQAKISWVSRRDKHKDYGCQTSLQLKSYSKITAKRHSPRVLLKTNFPPLLLSNKSYHLLHFR